MPTETSLKETQNQPEGPCPSASLSNASSGTAANGDDTVGVQVEKTCEVSVPTGPPPPATSTEGNARDSGTDQTQPQNAQNAKVNVPTTTSSSVVSSHASAQPVTLYTSIALSNVASKSVMCTRPQAISSVVVENKFSTSGANAGGQPPQIGPPINRMATVTQTPGKSVVIPAPRATTSQPITAPPRTTLTTSVQLPANFQIPQGMVLIRSDSGQLMLVSQQALAQAQGMAPRNPAVPSPSPTHPQVSAATVSRKIENSAVIKVPPPPSTRMNTVQRTTPVVKVVGAAPIPPAGQISQPVIRPVPQLSPLIIPIKASTHKATPPTITRETLENVKKCKNFLVTLIKLASSGTQSANMAKNVRELVRSLLDGRLEPEEFTDRLYHELKSSPQPYLVPFLKKSLPAVRQLTPNPQLFIQQVDQLKPQASTSKTPTPTLTRTPTLLSTNVMPSTLGTGSAHPMKPTQLVVQHPRGVPMKSNVTSSGPSRTFLSVQNRTLPKHMVIQTGQQHTGALVRQPFTQGPPPLAHRHTFKDNAGSFREEDDINDVASMAGVNLSEENACILATNSALVGTVVRSCRDEPFLPPAPLLTRILHTAEALGVSEVVSDVVSLVSHATEDRLRDLLEKVTLVVQHRKISLKDDFRHTQVSDVRSQLRFLEQLERLEKQRRDDEERERMLRIAKCRSNTEDPDQQLLKQRAIELQQLEQAQLQYREANLTALAAIGPRRKRPLDPTGSQAGGAGSCGSVLQRAGAQTVTRVTLRDLLLCMEQDPALRHSLTLYKALLR